MLPKTKPRTGGNEARISTAVRAASALDARTAAWYRRTGTAAPVGALTAVDILLSLCYPRLVPSTVLHTLIAGSRLVVAPSEPGSGRLPGPAAVLAAVESAAVSAVACGGRAGECRCSLGLDGCEVRLCDPCARVHPCVPCVSRVCPGSPRCLKSSGESWTQGTLSPHPP